MLAGSGDAAGCGGSGMKGAVTEKTAANLVKAILPQPEAGSQPLTAVKPELQQARGTGAYEGSDVCNVEGGGWTKGASRWGVVGWGVVEMRTRQEQDQRNHTDTHPRLGLTCPAEQHKLSPCVTSLNKLALW